MARWRTEEKPQLFEEESAQQVDSSFLDLFRRYDLRNIAAHGIRTEHGASYFSFHRIPERLTARHADILWLLVPHMHMALQRVSNDPSRAVPDVSARGERITRREAQVLRLIAFGKTEREIATILCVSSSTVAHHVEHILEKLKARNRPHAVYKAIELGILTSVPH
jgi:LuxR family transcriptional regulator, quorum-sensing system regulator CviR